MCYSSPFFGLPPSDLSKFNTGNFPPNPLLQIYNRQAHFIEILPSPRKEGQVLPGSVLEKILKASTVIAEGLVPEAWWRPNRGASPTPSDPEEGYRKVSTRHAP